MEKRVGTGNFKSKIRSGNDLARRRAKKSPYETVLIVCEGEKTECNYFRDLRASHKLNTANIIVTKGKGSAPINVVNDAIAYAENTPEIDYVMCIFDRDEHSSFQQALDKIKYYKPKRKAKSKPQYHAITSTPCFEIWLLLHFIYTTQLFYKNENKSAADNLISMLRKHWPEYTKNNVKIFTELNDKLPAALKNSKKLAKHNKDTNSDNPATNVNELIERLTRIRSSREAQFFGPEI